MTWNRWAAPPLLALLLSFVVAGVAMAVLDAEQPVGASGVVWVNGFRDGEAPAARAEVDERLGEYAAKSGTAIARARPVAGRAEKARALYVVESVQGERVPRVPFNPQVHVTVAGLSEDPRSDARAFYYVFGDGVDDVVWIFRDMGYVVETFPAFWSIRNMAYVLGGYMTPVVSLSVLLVIVLTVTIALQASREFAVARLNGRSGAWIVGSVVLRVVRPFGIGALVLASSGALALWVLNRWADIGLYVFTSSVFAGAGLAVWVVGLLLGVGLATRRGIRSSLAGRADSASALVALVLVNGAALLAVIGVVVSVTLLVSDLRRLESESHVAVSAPDGGMAHLVLSGSTATDLKSVENAVGPALRKAAERGRVVVADAGPDEAPLVQLSGGPGRVFKVNRTYLERNPELIDAIGGIPDTRNAITVLVPADRRDVATRVAAEVVESLRFETELRGEPMPKVNVHALGTSQTWPVYQDVSGLRRTTELVDPVVVLLADDLAPISDPNLTSAAAQSRVFFTDEEAAHQAVADGGLGVYVYSVVTSAQARAEAEQRVWTTLQQQCGALVVGLLVLALSSLALAALLTEARRQALFAQWVHGWGWWRRHGVEVAAYVLISAALAAAWVGWAQPDTGVVLPPGEADRAAVRGVSGSLVTALAAGVFIAAVAVVSSRKDHSNGADS